MGMIIAVSSYKGGCGKSTVSVNLAEALRRAGKDTSLVDIDTSTQTTLNWYKAYQPVNGEDPPLPKVMSMAGRVGDSLNKLAQVHEIVLVDCGAGNTIENQTAVQVADLLLVPVSPSGVEVLPTLRYASEIAAVQIKNQGRPHARLVLNKMQGDKAGSRELIETAFSTACAIKPLNTLIPNRSAFERLNIKGVSVFDFPRCSDLRDIFDAMAKEVVGILATAAPLSPRK